MDKKDNKFLLPADLSDPHAEPLQKAIGLSEMSNTEGIRWMAAICVNMIMRGSTYIADDVIDIVKEAKERAGISEPPTQLEMLIAYLTFKYFTNKEQIRAEYESATSPIPLRSGEA